MARPKSNGTKDSTATIGFEAKLWLAADSRGEAETAEGNRSNNMDAAEPSGARQPAAGSPQGQRGGAEQYKHVVLGLIVLKYISDTFEEHRAKLLAGEGDYPGANPEDPAEPSGARQPAAGSPKGQRGGAEQYKAENVFWVPADARWSHLQASAKQPTIGKTVDDAMVAIERDNPRLKGVLPKDYARPGLDKHRLGELIDLIATISLTAASEGEKTHRSVDILGASPAPRARTAASSTPRPASCAASSRCSPPTKAASTTPPAAQAACSCSRKSSWNSTAASSATSPSTARTNGRGGSAHLVSQREPAG
jgi:type I restriction enzyme M protein